MPEPTKSQPFVGRKTQLEQLQEAFNSAVSTRKPRFALIQGDFGVGKTALAKHFLEQVLAQNPSVLIGQGMCAGGTELSGLIPFSQLLSSLSEQGIGQRIVTGDVPKFFKEVAPAWLKIIPSVGEVLATTVTESFKFLDRSTFSQENVFTQFTNALRRLSETHPLIAFIEDLHWADASSLNLLFHLGLYLQERPVLFICTYRPVEAATSSNAALFGETIANLRQHGAVDVILKEGIDVKEYVAQRYPLNTFSSDLAAHVQEITEGHALFVGQLFSLWEETGVVTFTPAPDGQKVWKLTKETTAYPIVPEISAVFEERIRLVADELREILTCASVEGEEFTAQVIARLRQLDEYNVNDSLEKLQKRYRLIEEEDTKKAGLTLLDFYHFTQRFFREYIHDQLNKGKRRILHQRVGECLENLYADRHPIAGQLALHFQEAKDFAKCTRYALMAVDYEQTHFAWLEGEKWCELGLTYAEKLPAEADESPLRLDLLERSGFGYYASGNYSQAESRYREAIALAQQLHADPARIANLFEKLADISEYEGRLDEAMKYLDQGSQALTDQAVPFGETQVKLESMRGFVQTRLGQNDLAVQALRKVLADTDRLPFTPALENIKARANNRLATALGNLGKYSEAIGPYQNALGIAGRTGDGNLEAICLLNMADDCLKMSEPNQSMDYSSQALKIAEQLGDLDNVAYARAEKGSALLFLRQYQEATSELTAAIALAEQIGSVWNMPYVYADLAIASLGLPDANKGYEYATRSVTAAEQAADEFAKGYAIDALAQVQAAMKNRQAAADNFNQAIAIHQGAGQRHFAARTQVHYADALLAQGDTQKAVELLNNALVIFRELQLSHETDETERTLKSITAKTAGTP